MIQQRISALIELAKIDGSFDDTEKSLIMRIGKSNGMSESEIQQIIFGKNEDVNWEILEEDEKFDLLYDAILVMKVDGQILDEEVTYCQMLARKLGFDLRVVMELYADIHPSVKVSGLKEKLRRKVSTWQT
jgi:uncharacterized membrane protein YebE (DUF533 family)